MDVVDCSSRLEVDANMLTLGAFVRDSAKKTGLAQFQLACHLVQTSMQLKNEPEGRNTQVIEIGEQGPTIYMNSRFLRDKRSDKKSFSDALRMEGVRWIKQLAGSNLAEAQHFLGECHTMGIHGIPKNTTRAFYCFLQAAKLNHTEASYQVGVCYEHGQGVRKDSQRAIHYYRKAASLGSVHSMHRLALVLLHGELNQVKAPREAITWLKRSASLADEKYPRPIYDLALCYEKSSQSSVIPDEGYAFELLLTAAGYGYSPSQYKVGCCYEFGLLGCSLDLGKAIGWYAKAAEQSHPAAELSLSIWYLTGCEGVLEQCHSRAFSWGMRSALSGYSKGEFAVGHYYENGIGCQADQDEAVVWYRKAASKGNQRSIARLEEIRQSKRRRARRCC